MFVHLRCPIQSLTTICGRKFFISSSSQNSQSLIFSKPRAMNMNLELKSKRPTCPNCSRPLSVCLCSRIKSPNLDNQVNVTILQHSLEKNHPLNSARIATIGMKNLSVATVFDVNFEARFDIRPLEAEFLVEEDERTQGVCENSPENRDGHVGKVLIDENGPPRMSISIEKYGKISSIDPCMVTIEEIVDSSFARELVANGFVVRKFRRLQEAAMKEVEEFEIAIAPGTAILFPSGNSVGAEEVDFEVKNLIVLDGTWSKANRIYNENPWLRLLPCVRLDVEKASLYSEVRNQPKPGCLSTLESIVYALEAFGEKESVVQGLENLLQVFESMVEDQRRCKKERLESEGA